MHFSATLFAVFAGLILSNPASAADADAGRGPALEASAGISSPDGGAGLSATSAGQSKASLSTVTAGSAARRIRAELLNWTTLKEDNFSDGQGQATTQNFIGLNYKIGPTSGLSVRLPFIHSFEFPKSDGVSSDVHAQDAYIDYQNSQLLPFWKDAKLMLISARVGLPTGEESRFLTKTHGYARTWLAASKPLAPHWNFNLHMRTYWYNQSQNTYVNAAGATVGTKDWGIDEFPEIEWRPTPAISVTHATGTTHFWYRPGYAVPTKQDFWLSSWTAFNFQASDAIALTFALSNDADLNPVDRPFGPYRSDETAYHFILSAVL